MFRFCKSSAEKDLTRPTVKKAIVKRRELMGTANRPAAFNKDKATLTFVSLTSSSHHIHSSEVRLLEHLIGCVKNHLCKGNGHGEEHPDVDHLEVGGNR